jgi:hypothetical protein
MYFLCAHKQALVDYRSSKIGISMVNVSLLPLRKGHYVVPACRVSNAMLCFVDRPVWKTSCRR